MEEYFEIEFGKELDLHHFHPDDTEMIVEEFLKNAIEKGYELVRIAHGKGRSKKKRRVHKILENHSNVIEYKDEGYNWGATVVRIIIAFLDTFWSASNVTFLITFTARWFY